jgi:hypothetical protein
MVVCGMKLVPALILNIHPLIEADFHCPLPSNATDAIVPDRRMIYS